jgi:hypothetical protein
VRLRLARAAPIRHCTRRAGDPVTERNSVRDRLDLNAATVLKVLCQLQAGESVLQAFVNRPS